MNETEFILLTEKIFEDIESKIEQWCYLHDIDIDIEIEGNVLSITFKNNSKIIINTQRAIQEIWISDGSNGFHYWFNGDSWKDTRGGSDFPDTFLKICSNACGIKLN